MHIMPGRLFRSVIAVALSLCNLFGAEQHGTVTFGGLPVPGATVTASQGEKKLTTVTDAKGAYVFPDLADGAWSIQIEMLGFAPLKSDVTVAPDAPASSWDLKMLPLNQIHAEAQTLTPSKPTPPAPVQPGEQKNPEAGAKQSEPQRDELAQRAADGLLINGSQNNGASSPFALGPAFGNNRNGSRSLYNGNLAIFVDDSIWDGRPFSLTGQSTPRPAYDHLTGAVAFGGPLRIPRLIQNGPNFFIAYQWQRNRNDSIATGLMPTLAERTGNLSQIGTPIIDPETGAPFPGNIIPQSRISPQAQALLALYPRPNFTTPGAYNYQIPLVGASHQDSVQGRLNKTLDRKNVVFGDFALQNTRQSSPNIFGFLDTTDSQGISTSAHWFHRFQQGLFGTFSYQFSRWSMNLTPFFENRENVPGAAGISGNDQSPLDWGPPNLTFASGIQGLSDSEQSTNHNETNAVSAGFFWNRGRHNFQFGGDFKRQQFNVLGQNNGRGSFTFTGGATGSDFADFLLGTPDAASLAFGNADKYFRDSLYDTYFTDDWRINSALTLNAGVRWEYESPITELYGRLVNLDVIPGFSDVAPVVANNPVGPLTGLHYPDSLMHPDKRGFEPRVGLAWRPIAASSWVIRSGYGVYYDTSVYQTLASQMSQQYPLSKSLSVQNTPATPLTLANGFNTAPLTTPDTFGIDPYFRPGYAQNWQLQLQRDLPGSLQMVATYLGIKGTHGTQEFLPNAYPLGAVNECPGCPAGFLYVTSNGDSTRESSSIQLRRRLHSGLTASIQYTLSKSIDDDAVLGGAGASATMASTLAPASASSAASASRNLVVAQNWLDLSAERSLSSFDQRQLLTEFVQYTTGMGVAGGTLLSGWRGRLFKGWMFTTNVSEGTGLPLTPTYLAPEEGTGVVGAVRPEYTGAALYNAPPGLSLNPAAYAPPPPGQWGNAGRNSITGPSIFSMTASAGRTFRLSDRLSGDLRIDCTNPLNHVTFTSWNTIYGNAQFGLPTAANAMRSLTTAFIVRF